MSLALIKNNFSFLIPMDTVTSQQTKKIHTFAKKKNMSIERAIKKRSNLVCELCTADENLAVYEVGPNPKGTEKDSIFICTTCSEQIEDEDKTDANHWRCLNDSMWSEVDAVKVVAYRMLDRMKSEGWPQDLLDMIYMEEDVLAWAKDGIEDTSDKVIHKDSNGVVLQAGDNVVLIKDLKVKGGGFTAKRGTAVRRISLVWNNPNHIEGRVEDQHIVILTQYVKKI